MSANKKHFHIFHFGNVANNGYFNSQMLSQIKNWSSEPVQSWTQHAMSDPTWETLEFEIPSLEFINNPDWKLVPGASEFRASKVIYPALEASLIDLSGFEWLKLSILIRLRKIAPTLGKWAKSIGVPDHLRAKAWHHVFRPFANLLYRKLLVRPRIQKNTLDDSTENKIQIFYGAPDYSVVDTIHSKIVLLEHGTLRWIEVGAPEDLEARRKYETFVSKADHLWVTNLDLATTEKADQLAPMRWSAFPHPYILDSRFQLPESRETHTDLRNHLLRSLNSRYLVFLPSSLNWKSDHDKGSFKALEAFVALRLEGFDVGLICANWGRQVDEAKKFLTDNKVSPYVYWTDPLPRVNMQKLMLECDAVWDQFGAPGFGALAIKTMEVGVPLVTHGLSQLASSLIGEEPPWVAANCTAEIISKSRELITFTDSNGLQGTRFAFGQPQRNWLERRHHHEIGKLLQFLRYRQITRASEITPAKADAWASIPDFGTEEWHKLVEESGYMELKTRGEQ